MAIYAFPEFDGESRRASRIYASARYPSRQEGNVFFDSEEVPNLKYADEMPLQIRNFYSVVAFRPSHIFLSRDVLGGRPLYYGSDMSISSFKSYIDGEVYEVMPGEVVKMDYTGEILERRKYAFEDVFRVGREDVNEMADRILNSLSSYKPRVGCIAFSGGVDSSLLAALYDAPLVSVTASDAEEEWLKTAARMFGKEIEILKVGESAIREVVDTVRKTIETGDFLQLSIAVPVYLTMQFAKSLGFTEIIFGQGADELFGGYKRYEGLSEHELEDALVKDLKSIGESNLVRDCKLAYKNEIKLVTPYLCWDVIDAALKIPPEYKVRREGGKVVRKYILRKIAEKFLPEEIAWRDKKAIQYSTGIAKILKKCL
ncbi:MAG: Asparagine synthetase (AsnB) [Archaeoglobus fulgidus]|uniref:Asparagine synthetase (AsnB) n=1 Tax=Archaeoglobus fulgidus TaxID=2234 RepID=A0A101E2Y5_ARCFL|nr:asparagine synthetase B [Archaeoglobus fulgidus]KUJ94441.1 MAG: Asparagine synthetase (AsnB) [Archaeoglobus fulgidus]KUK07365.1 MAG: Asparagine synthetase (AsnB) [Archaeoglobus fulgidus]